MNINSPPGVVAFRRGLSLFELTVVIATLLALIMILTVGARSWKRGADRAACIMNIRNMQVATRSYQNMYGYDDGTRPLAENGTQDIAKQLYAKGYIEQSLFNHANGAATCAAGGSCHCPVPDIFPPPGRLFMECSLADSELKHQPRSHDDW